MDQITLSGNGDLQKLQELVDGAETALELNRRTATVLLALAAQSSQSTSSISTMINPDQRSNFKSLADMATASNTALQSVAVHLQKILDPCESSNFKSLADTATASHTALQSVATHLQKILDPCESSNFKSLADTATASHTALQSVATHLQKILEPNQPSNLQTLAQRGQQGNPLHVVIDEPYGGWVKQYNERLDKLERHCVQLSSNAEHNQRELNKLRQEHDDHMKAHHSGGRQNSSDRKS